jgi:uncharacterized cupredoxin-like copper-binding protein
MNRALRSTLAVGGLTLVLAFVLVSCGSGGGGGAGKGSSSTSKATTSGKVTTSGSSGGSRKYGSASSAATTTTKGTSKGASQAASGRRIKTIVIQETEFELSPSSVTLSKAGTYAFKAQNKGSTQHSLEIDGEGVVSKGGKAGEARLEQDLDPGQSGVLAVTFKKPGTYEMYCPIIGHRLAGMKGSVVVK